MFSTVDSGGPIGSPDGVGVWLEDRVGSRGCFDTQVSSYRKRDVCVEITRNILYRGLWGSRWESWLILLVVDEVMAMPY